MVADNIAVHAALRRRRYGKKLHDLQVTLKAHETQMRKETSGVAGYARNLRTQETQLMQKKTQET